MSVDGSEPMSDSKLGFEKQINVFNLKDTLIHPQFSTADRLEALAKLKR